MGRLQRAAGIACMIMLTVSSYAGATFHPGDRGDQIIAIQQGLNAAGNSVYADGDYGTATTQAVKAFQASHGLDADGIVGADTYYAITGASMPDNNCTHFVEGGATAAPVAPAAPAVPAVTADNEISVIQQSLVNKGYGISVDGVFGSGTESAVRQFQASQGLETDGVVGPQTFYALTGQSMPEGPVIRSNTGGGGGSTYSSPTLRQVLGIANQFIGVPYVYGGNTPDGFDCSGFTRYVYSSVGVDLPRCADEQYYVGQSVSYSSLQPGDLVFFGHSGISHTGIYIGNDQFISATNSGGVSIASLDSGYWSARYVGAKRVL